MDCGTGVPTICSSGTIAKFRRCKVLFVSVGAGPIHGILGKYFVRTALSLADFRSYRDNASMDYLRSIGLATNGDRVYPDLVFSLPQAMIPDHGNRQRKRPVVGLGLMEYAGRYSFGNLAPVAYSAYLEKLVVFGTWLLNHGYDIRLLIGDSGDRNAIEELKVQLKRILECMVKTNRRSSYAFCRSATRTACSNRHSGRDPVSQRSVRLASRETCDFDIIPPEMLFLNERDGIIRILPEHR